MFRKDMVFSWILTVLMIISYQICFADDLIENEPQITPPVTVEDSSPRPDSQQIEPQITPPIKIEDSSPRPDPEYINPPIISLIPKTADSPKAEPQYYVRTKSSTMGPIREKDLIEKIKTNGIHHMAEITIAGTEQWKPVYEMFSNIVYSKIPQVSVKWKPGFFGTPYKLTVDGKKYQVRKSVQSLPNSSPNSITLSFTGYLYPSEQMERERIPIDYRSGHNYFDYFYTSALGKHVLEKQVNLGQVAKMNFSRKMMLLYAGLIGVVVAAVPLIDFAIKGADNFQWDILNVACLASGSMLAALAIIVNPISRRRIYRILRTIDTTQQN